MSRPLRCGACGQLVESPVLIQRPDGKFVGSECSGEADGALMEASINHETPALVVPEPGISIANYIDVLEPPKSRRGGMPR